MDVVARSQRGRICEFRKNEKTIVTPYIMSVDNDSDDPMHISLKNGKRVLNYFGDEVELDQDLMTSESSNVRSEPVLKNGVCVVRLPYDDIEIPKDTELLVISNAFELRKDARKLVKNIMLIRQKAGNNILIAAPGLADAGKLALFTYMGIDIFDDSVARASGLNGILSIPEGEIVYNEDTINRNILAIRTECSKIHDFIMGGRLRELVDQRVASPVSVATLRIFDNEGHDYQEEACAVTGTRFACNTVQSLRRPDVLRYRKRIMENYEKPANKKVLLLLPCSAKKPYHISKTHKRFASAIHTAPHDTLVHEVIVTSPLGIVPRELDIFYPACAYDIPVTGEWKPEERAFIREMLSKLLGQGYDKVVSHLGEDTELVRGLCEMEETVIGDDTSPASLTKLDETLRAVTKGMKCDFSTDRKETMRSVLKFQFGKDVADTLIDENTTVTGKFPYWKIIRDDVQLGMMTADRGMVSLTFEGAELIAPLGHYTVEMTDFELKGSLFAVGVTAADEKIRIGDEAIVMLNGKVKAVGVAMMSGREMVELNRGVAVKIRHKQKD